MDYFYLLAALLAGAHTATYGLWLKGQGNRAGAVLTVALALVCVGLPVARILTGP